MNASHSPQTRRRPAEQAGSPAERVASPETAPGAIATGEPSSPLYNSTNVVDARPAQQHADEMVKIRRTYKFAGELIMEEKVVRKDSAEAQLFRASGEKAERVSAAELEENAISAVKLRRPLRKVSRFDPNPTGAIKKSWEKQKQQLGAAVDADGAAKGPKINVVEKSKMDWAAYVDQVGMKDELLQHSKAKEGYLGRMDFLGRVDAKREEERRNMRLKGLK